MFNHGNGGATIVMGVPNSWLVYFMENPNPKWMMTDNTSMTMETTIYANEK